MLASLMEPLGTGRDACAAGADVVPGALDSLGDSARGLLGSMGRKNRQPVEATMTERAIGARRVRRANIAISVNGLEWSERHPIVAHGEEQTQASAPQPITWPWEPALRASGSQARVCGRKPE